MTKQFVLLVLTGLLGKAQPAPTQIGLHRVGETLEEWLAVTKALDGMDAICQSKKRDDKARCKDLSDLRDGKKTVLKTEGAEGRTMTWEFDGRKLAIVSIDAPTAINPFRVVGTIQDEIRFLIETYGEAKSIKTVPYQNGYGTQWECLEALWEMPDGTSIRAIESISQSQKRFYYTTFLSKEFLEKGDRKQQSRPNPYK